MAEMDRTSMSTAAQFTLRPTVRGRMTIRPDNVQRSRPNRRTRLMELYREPVPGTTLHSVVVAHDIARDVNDKMYGISAEIKTRFQNDDRLTDVGRNKEFQQNFRNHVVNEVIPRLDRGRAVVDKAREEVSALRAKIAMPSTDKTDVPAALRREEMRKWLRSMPTDARNQFIAANQDKLHPEMVAAVAEMPAALSGLMESDRNSIVDSALQAQHGDALEQIHELEHAIEATESVIVGAYEEARLEAEVFDQSQFKEMVETKQVA